MSGTPSEIARVDGGTPIVRLNDPFAGGGDVGALMRAHHWESTPLGPVGTWPQSLLTALSICVRSKFPTVIYWGPKVATFYNDGYVPILADKHPWAIGRPITEVWAEIWTAIEGMIDEVVSTGVATWSEDQLLLMRRKGYLEECYFTWSFAPIMIESGETGGLYCAVIETTGRVLGERRLRTLRELGSAASDTRSVDRACEEAFAVLGASSADVPFALLYLLDADGKQARLASTSGIEPGLAASPLVITLGDEHDAEASGPLRGPLRRVAQTGEEQLVSDLAIRLRDPEMPDAVTSALVLPLGRAGQSRGLLVAGVSPRLALDESYRAFLHLVGEQLTAHITNASSYEEERKRVDALAAIDRAKTTFFSNVSHELRTPLTLILGPVEEALAESAKSLQGDSLQSVHRNAMRLLRLVNSLLDFARLEAGRLQVQFVRTDLSTLTSDLASSFRSLIERAGLQLIVDCPPIAEPVYVDPSKWEKIVLNLISNAFKFTFSGAITVSLRACGDHVELTVRDTGTGIPERELAQIFDRFHRVEGATGRSIEGTGIGLSLVSELVKVHGGSVSVSSAEGQGSAFCVSLPTGCAHLPPERVVERAAVQDAGGVAGGVASYLLEASQWMGVSEDAIPLPTPPDAATSDRRDLKAARARVLVADDNADMREYLTRLLSTRWQVEAVDDGEAALASAKRLPPDLVLSDVMMPKMDGVALLSALRADEQTRHVPVVLLSARAGEEAILKGLETGADDYLVKPFAARELVARVQTHLDMARLRHDWTTKLERANAELEAFSYSVSHDLRAPLRAIDGFSLALLKESAGQLDEQGRHYLERVRTAAQRMARLIDDLLSLSRITRAPLRLSSVDMSGMARNILDELQLRDPARTVEARVQDGLVVQADPGLLQVLLENLLGNAWKFTSRRAAATIEVGCEDRGGEAAFFVRDNGAGFALEHATRLFQPFQRLHAAAEFEGTGIGLATVARVVRRHGGRTWAEAAPEKGATLYFALGSEWSAPP